MGINCAGRHECEPPFYPTSLDDRWTCPDCLRTYATFVIAESHLPESAKRMAPAGALGWTAPAQVADLSESELEWARSTFEAGAESWPSE